MNLTQWLRLHLPVFMGRDDVLRQIEDTGTVMNLVFQLGQLWEREQHRRRDLELVAKMRELEAIQRGTKPPPEVA